MCCHRVLNVSAELWQEVAGECPSTGFQRVVGKKHGGFKVLVSSEYAMKLRGRTTERLPHLCGWFLGQPRPDSWCSSD